MKRKFFFLFLTFFFSWAGFLAAQDEPVFAGGQENINKVSINLESAEPAAVSMASGLEKMVFQLKFVSPQIVADNVREMMGAAPGGVIVNEQLRQLEVSASAEMLDKIKSLVLSIDKEYDIAVDVKVVQVDLNEEHLPGINWSAIVSGYKSFMVPEDTRKFSAGTVSSEDLAILLEALETVGEMKAFPVKTVKANNGEDADLRLKAFDRNVTVSVTPVLAGASDLSEKQDRYTARLVLASIASAEDAVDFRIVSSDGSAVTVHVKNDNVAVIGGIFTQTKSEFTKKFPFLGDLPLLGVVFRDQSKTVRRLENIIFLTPHVSTPSVSSLSK